MEARDNHVSEISKVSFKDHSGTTGGGTAFGSLTEEQRGRFMRLFHQQYGRYPQSTLEIQSWLRDTW